MELLSPAGSPEAVRAAVENGANAVYLGLGDFNARRRAKNFSPQDLADAVSYCHVRGAKVYLTLNTLLSDRELAPALEQGRLANSLGVDAVLVQDLGLARALRAAFPDLPLHASTQMSVHSLAGVELCAELGMTRVVLSRELSRDAISRICEHSPVEIEIFAHGALCMCYSGQCFLSALLGGRSGNRGLCAQPCRLPYRPDGGAESHPLSLKDLSLAGHLRELEDMGVACVKLEGRMKRPEYVAVVTRVYAAALRERREPTREELAALREAFSRSGFTQGYYLDEKGPRMFGVRAPDAPPEALYAQARASYQKDTPLVPVRLTLEASAGAPVSAVASDDRGHTVRAEAPAPQAALHRPTSPEEARAQLVKTGGTPYYAADAAVSVEPGLLLPKSLLNRLRRELLDQLTGLRAQPPRRRSLPPPPPPGGGGHAGPPQAVFTLRTADQLTPELWRLPHRRIDLPPAELLAQEDKTRAALAEGAVLSAALPRVVWDRERPGLARELERLRELGLGHALVSTWDALSLARGLGFALHGDFGLGVYNAQTLAGLRELGLESATASFELRLSMLRDLDKPLAVEAVVYGHLPLMLLEQPPGGNPCGALTDRMGLSFPVLPAPGGRWELFNSQLLYLADKSDWRALGLSAYRLLFTAESPRECLRVAREYAGGPLRPPKSFTRGLYYREVE